MTGKKTEAQKWVQMTGHRNSIVRSSANCITKLQGPESMEASFYQSLGKDPMCKLTARYVDQFQRDGKQYIELENLLCHFKDPCILDVKMGTRTFLECETENFQGRNDLYEKMMQVDPNEPTNEEAAKKMITKLRYMQFRENASSSASLGYRLEAMSIQGEPVIYVSKNCKANEGVRDILINKFLKKNRQVCQSFYNRLKEIERTLIHSNVFKNHEFVGTSLLFIYDDTGSANIWMIDFAKTRPQAGVDHSATWQNGNHADGYLIGIRNLILTFENFSIGTAI